MLGGDGAGFEVRMFEPSAGLLWILTKEAPDAWRVAVLGAGVTEATLGWLMPQLNLTAQTVERAAFVVERCGRVVQAVRVFADHRVLAFVRNMVAQTRMDKIYAGTLPADALISADLDKLRKRLRRYKRRNFSALACSQS
jgi:hypothetical protein